MAHEIHDEREGCKAEIYLALCLAAKARQDAYNETRATYRKASENTGLSDEHRRDSFILSSVFLSLAKAARMEAEAMRDIAQSVEAPK